MAQSAYLSELAAQASRGDIGAIRRLHFGNDAPREPDTAWDHFCTVAGPEFCRIIDAGMPKLRVIPAGGIDFHRLHSLALDSLDELLAFLLPIGVEGASNAGSWCWFGAHPDRRTIVAVCLLTGAWNEPNTGKGGRDLVGLFAHLFGVSSGRAAHMLAKWVGAEVRPYA